MKSPALLIAGLVSLGLLAPISYAQPTYIYPAKGQSDEQIEKDKYECYQWASKESGFDPMQSQQATQPQPQQPTTSVGGAGRGAAKGAAIGAVGGAIADNDVGRSAAIGAAVGGIAAGVRQRRQQLDQLQQQQAIAHQQSQQRANYNRAYGVCLEGRGYTVK
jgi:hypothetical protein